MTSSSERFDGNGLLGRVGDGGEQAFELMPLPPHGVSVRRGHAFLDVVDRGPPV